MVPITDLIAAVVKSNKVCGQGREQGKGQGGDREGKSKRGAAAGSMNGEV